MLKNMTIGIKMLLGFGIITLILAVSVLTTIRKVDETNEINSKLINLRAPTVQASLSMLNGMNHSLAALRGWIILGKDKFKDERALAWSKEIDKSLVEMKKFSLNWTNPKNVERLKIIEKKLSNFRIYQHEIEDIANTQDNTPATKILFTEAAPLANIMVDNITTLIDLEGKQEATEERKALLGMMADVRGTIGLALANIRAYLLSGNEKFKTKFDILIAKNIKRFGDLSGNAGLFTPEQAEAFAALSSAREKFIPLPSKMFDIRGSNEWDLSHLWLATKAAPTGFAIKKQLDEMIADQKQLMLSDATEARALSTSLANMEWMLLAIGLTISIAITVFLPRNISRQIKKPIKNVIAQMTTAFTEFSSAAEQISESSQTLAQGSSEQASSLEETSSTMEELSTMTKLNAENSHEASNLAKKCNDSAQNGNDAINEMCASIDKMNSISMEIVNSMGNSMDEINTSSNEIAEITKVIDSIAFQTNLLALNAAVEAARAGDHGKGFAVVAEEVRNLAQRSAAAAKDTAVLIKNSVEKASKGTELAGRSKDTLQGIVEDVKKSTDNTSKVLQEIAANVEKVTTLTNEISSASSEQSEGINSINSSIRQLDQVTQQNAATAEEVASTSEEMTAQSITLKTEVGTLSDLVNDGNIDVDKSQTGQRLHSKDKQPTNVKSKSNGIKSVQKQPNGPNALLPLDDSEVVEYSEQFTDF